MSETQLKVIKPEEELTGWHLLEAEVCFDPDIQKAPSRLGFFFSLFLPVLALLLANNITIGSWFTELQESCMFQSLLEFTLIGPVLWSRAFPKPIIVTRRWARGSQILIGQV